MNASATLRLGLAGLLAVAGLGLIVYGAVNPQAGGAMETGKWLLLGSPLTAWSESLVSVSAPVAEGEKPAVVVSAPAPVAPVVPEPVA